MMSAVHQQMHRNLRNQQQNSNRKMSTRASESIEPTDSRYFESQDSVRSGEFDRYPLFTDTLKTYLKNIALNQMNFFQLLCRHHPNLLMRDEYDEEPGNSKVFWESIIVDYEVNEYCQSTKQRNISSLSLNFDFCLSGCR